MPKNTINVFLSAITIGKLERLIVWITNCSLWKPLESLLENPKKSLYFTQICLYEPMSFKGDGNPDEYYVLYESF